LPPELKASPIFHPYLKEKQMAKKRPPPVELEGAERRLVSISLCRYELGRKLRELFLGDWRLPRDAYLGKDGKWMEPDDRVSLDDELRQSTEEEQRLWEAVQLVQTYLSREFI